MPENREAHLAHFNLKIGGSQAQPEVIDQMLDCTVENSLHLPDVCTLRLHDAGFRWLDADTFREGTKIEVWGAEEREEGASGNGRPPLQPLFKGEVSGLELDLAGHGVPTLLVRCYDLSHRLHRGRYSRSFVQMTDTDIVRKVAEEAEFTVHADNSSQVHDWVLQNNQTNWEFLTERSARIGFHLYVQGERDLYFRKVKDSGDETLTLDWGKSLRSFRPRIAATPQVDEVVVRGWDPKEKQAILGRCQQPTGVPQIGETAPGGDVARKAFGAARLAVVDRPVHSQAEADDLARSICDDMGGRFLEADGLCYGQPKLRPGMMVRIDNIGRRFSGRYMATSTTHVYSAAEGYTTLFTVSAKRPSTLLSLLQEDGGGKRSRLGGNIVVAVVTDNKDPDNLGRVKVKYPWLTEDHTSFWARIATPMAGPDRGFYFLPEINDEVLVAFEHGDIRRPYLLGALWNGKDHPVEGNDQAVSGGKVNRRQIKTRIGHTLLFDDTQGKGQVQLITRDGREMSLNDADGEIRLTDKAKNQVVIRTEGNAIAIECGGDFTVKAGGKVSIRAQRGMELQTDMDLTINGQMVRIN
jgi:phage protein D